MTIDHGPLLVTAAVEQDMLNWKRQYAASEEVIHSVDKQIMLSEKDIDHLIELASKTKRQRFRYCVHQSKTEPVQEMFIAHASSVYVRPHQHINKIESMLVLRGEVDFVVFEPSGSIRHCLQMGDQRSGKIFYNSLREATFHTLLIRTDWLVFLETTKGPFNPMDTVFPSWCPGEREGVEVQRYMAGLNSTIDQMLTS